MKFVPLVAALSLAALPAMAQTAPPQPAVAPTLVMPTQLMAAIENKLSTMPIREAGQMYNELEACILAQVPDASGRIIDRGGCPLVTEALHPPAPKPVATKPAAEKPATSKPMDFEKK